MPLYGGFLYAAVGSHVCRSGRLLDLALTGYRARVTAVLAGGLYLNFLTGTGFWTCAGCWAVCCRPRPPGYGSTSPSVRTATGCRRLGRSSWPGFFLWPAENIAAYCGA